MIHWRIYYSDGSFFDNTMGGPSDAPAVDVQAIVCEPDLWHGGDIFGLYDYLIRSGKNKVVRFGRLISNENYNEVAYKARHDLDFDQNTRHVYAGEHYYWWEGE